MQRLVIIIDCVGYLVPDVPRTKRQDISIDWFQGARTRCGNTSCRHLKVTECDSVYAATLDQMREELWTIPYYESNLKVYNQYPQTFPKDCGSSFRYNLRNWPPDPGIQVSFTHDYNQWGDFVCRRGDFFDIVYPDPTNGNLIYTACGDIRPGRDGKSVVFDPDWENVISVSHVDEVINQLLSKGPAAPGVLSARFYGMSGQSYTDPDILLPKNDSQLFQICEDVQAIGLSKCKERGVGNGRIYYCWPEIVLLPSPTPNRVFDFIGRWAPDFEVGNEKLTEATCAAVDAAQYVEVNSIALIKDLKELKPGIEALIALSKKNVSPKTISDLFLSLRYGLNLTYQDLSSVSLAIKKAYSDSQSTKPFSTTRGQKTDSEASPWPGFTSQFNVKLYYEDPESAILNTIKSAMDWDLWPSLGNMWDLIPYSFVVDWFISIGPLFESIDRFAYFQYLSILEAVETYKYKFPGIHASQIWGTDFLPYPGLIIHGHVGISMYIRNCLPIARTPTLDLPEFNTEFHNWAEATALILQRKH